MNDAALLARVQAGDRHALDELLARVEPRVYRFGLRMCGNPSDAQDVLQETLLAAFKNLKDFRGDAQLSTWLFQIARSFCTKQRRRHEGEPAQHASLEAAQSVPDSAPSNDARAHARQVGEVISAAIATLPEEAREAIVLRDVEGLSAEEAALVVGIEVGALKSRLHRARLGLKQQLSAVLDAEPGAITCPELAHELAAYAGSDIDQAACDRIEKHLATCPNCRDACDALKRTVSLCRAIPGGEVPMPVKAAVRQALRGIGF
jgi:RNA polymerase sigma-70 factor, ECF subfamily